MQAVEECSVVAELEDSQLSDRVRTRLFSRLGQIRRHAVSRMMDAAFSEVAIRFQIAALVAPVNPAAPLWLLSREARAKEMTIRARTVRTGLRAGLVCRPETGDPLELRPLTIRLRERSLLAVRRGGRELWTLMRRDGDQPLRVCARRDGRFVTSDVDIVSLCYRSGAIREIPLVADAYGHLLLHEREFIESVNSRFSQLANQQYDGGCVGQVQLCTHGPSSRFDRPRQVQPTFPLRAYLPDGTVGVIGEEKQRARCFANVRDWRATLERAGFVVPWNPCWA